MTLFTASAKYLPVRLCLRKTGKWHRFSSLKYESELGDTILPALRELCGSKKRREKQVEVKVEVKVEEVEIIDLTMNDDEKPGPVAGPSKLSLLPPTPVVPDPPSYEFLADDSSEASLRELLECLTLPELKDTANTVKVKSNTTVRSRLCIVGALILIVIVLQRENIIESLLRTSVRQTTLPFPVVSAKNIKGKNRALRQTILPFAGAQKKRTQQDRLRELVQQVLGKRAGMMRRVEFLQTLIS